MRLRTLGLCAAVALTTAGCVPWESSPPYADFSNYTDEALTVSVEGTDEVHELAPHSSELGLENRCVGTGVLVTRADGSVLAAFDGKTCPSTRVRIDADGTVVVSDDLTTRSPAPTPDS